MPTSPPRTSTNYKNALRNNIKSRDPKAIKKKKKDFYANTPHFECADGDEEQLKNALRSWIKYGKASLRFGAHIKFIESLTKSSSPRQVDCTICMNAHGRCFQASIEMTELQGLLNPSGKVTKDDSIHTIRNLIL